MIPFDIVYRRPESVEEAVSAWRGDPENSLYYAGGTEIVTGARTGTYRLGILVDIKRLPECREIGARGDRLYYGAGFSLNEIVEDGSFPLLSAAARRVADHTVRNRITLGGNVAGRLPYREALLPFLAADGAAHLAGPDRSGGVGRRTVPIRELQAKRLVLGPGEFIVGLSIPAEAALLPFFHDRATAGPEIDYPIFSLSVVAFPGGVSAAISGYLDWPVRIGVKSGVPSVDSFPAPRGDARASREYRFELLRASLARAEEALE